MALNYNGTTYNKGLPGLSKWISNHMKKYHPRGNSNNDYEICVSSGSTDSLNKCIIMLSQPGDVILASEYTYTGILVNPKAQGRVIESVAMDSNGMIPKSLDSTCQRLRDAGKVVRIVYLIPTGQNPTGTTMSLVRRKEILKVCRKHDLVVIEDDPYFFLNLPQVSTPVPSMFSLDTDDRVVRLDSFSKTVAPGFRLGWVSAPKAFMAKFDALSQVTTWSASGIAQSVLLAILSEWGEKGFESQIKKLCETYTRRRDLLLKAMEKHLSDLATWTCPSAGMFVWIRINGAKDTREENLINAMLKAKIVMVPGGSFQPDTTCDCPYFRATFATAPEDSFEPAMRRFASQLRLLKN